MPTIQPNNPNADQAQRLLDWVNYNYGGKQAGDFQAIIDALSKLNPLQAKKVVDQLMADPSQFIDMGRGAQDLPGGPAGQLAGDVFGTHPVLDLGRVAEHIAQTGSQTSAVAADPPANPQVDPPGAVDPQNRGLYPNLGPDNAQLLATEQAGQDPTTITGVDSSGNPSYAAWTPRTFGVSDAPQQTIWDAPQISGLTPDTMSKDYKDWTGRDPQKDYQDYLGSFDDSRRGKPLGFQDWLRRQSDTAMSGSEQVMAAINAQYMGAYGGALPDELRSQIIDYLKSNPGIMDDLLINTQAAAGAYATSSSGVSVSPATGQAAAAPGVSADAALQAAVGKGAGAIAAIAPAIQAMITDYQTAHPSATQKKNQFAAWLTKDFESLLGRDPTTDEVNQLYGQDDISIQSYVNTQVVKGTSLTYGSYSAASQKANSIWKQYFNGSPSKSDIEKIASMKDPEQIQDWVMTQPSHISGMNIGEYETTHQAADQLSTKLWNMPASADLVNTLKKAMG